MPNRLGEPGFRITVDVEDHASASSGYRFQQAMEPLLERLRREKTVATFFVVGSLARSWRSTLAELVDEGHEIGLHGYTHVFIDRLGPDGFRQDIRQGQDELANLLGTAPAGYRAPYFSLTTKSPWAPDVLGEAGFRYSSSVLPAWNPQAGLSGAPRRAFRWPNGLVEFPAPVFGLGPIAAPVLGGAYLRLAPSLLVRIAARRHRAGQWTYSHPYDFDLTEPFTRVEGQQWWVTKLLFARRHLMLNRVMALADSASATLGALAADEAFVGTLTTFTMNQRHA